MKKIFSVINHKGGVGKTTTSLNVGAGLALMGYKVLLIDLDAQANLSQSVGMESEKENVYKALIGDIKLPTSKIKDNLFISISHLDLSVAELALAGEAGREFILKELIAPIKKQYDYIIIDCPPSLGLLTVNALVASDNVIIPLETQFLAIRGMKTLLTVIEKVHNRLNENLNSYKVLLTKYDSRRSLDKTVCDTIKKSYPTNLFKTIIRSTVSIAEAPIDKKDIFEYAPKSNGADDYMSMCKEIVNN